MFQNSFQFEWLLFPLQLSVKMQILENGIEFTLQPTDLSKNSEGSPHSCVEMIYFCQFENNVFLP